MCGRFAFHLSDLGQVAAAFGITLPESLQWQPRFNIAPTQDAPVVIGARPARAQRAAEPPSLRMLRWGLVPHWARDAAVGARAINARVESAASKPTFRDSVAGRRCIVPATGYFEWKKLGAKTKQAMWIHPPDDRPLWLAGLWARNRQLGDAPLDTFAIVTRDAEGALRDVHDRMPIALTPDGARAWLAPDNGSDMAMAILDENPQPVDGLQLTPVSDIVNSPRNDDPRCIEPVRARRSSEQLTMESLLGGDATSVDES